MSATEPRYCPISTLHRKLRQELEAKGGPGRPSPADFAPSQGSISTRSKRNSSSTHPFPILARSWLSAEVLPGCGLMSDGLRRRASASRASARTDLGPAPARATDGEPSTVPGASSGPGQWRVIEDDYLGAFAGSGSWCAACVHGGTVHGPGGSSGGGRGCLGCGDAGTTLEQDASCGGCGGCGGAEQFQVSHTTAARYRQAGAAGMADRPSRPHASPSPYPGADRAADYVPDVGGRRFCAGRRVYR